MKKTEHKKRIKAITSMMHGMEMSRKVLVIGEGLKPAGTQQTPFKILDGVDVFHSGYNDFEFEVPEFKAGKTHKWGEFYQPDTGLGQYAIGASHKVYVDTRIEGWYLLWISSKIDDGPFGDTEWEASPFAWTPKLENDTIKIAGLRMFWAAALVLDEIENDQDSSWNEEEGEWRSDWNCTTDCEHVFAAIRKTVYENDKEFFDFLDFAPDILKPHIAKRRSGFTGLKDFQDKEFV